MADKVYWESEFSSKRTRSAEASVSGVGQPASKPYLDSLYERRPISICSKSLGGQEYRYMDWVARIMPKGIETGKGGWFSRKTGYQLGIMVGGTAYIEEYIKP